MKHNKKILHLTLFKKWFDLIARGAKKREYRDIKPYWTKRLVGKKFNEIYFKNGYSKNAPFMRVQLKGMKREKDKYTLILGKVLEIKNNN